MNLSNGRLLPCCDVEFKTQRLGSKLIICFSSGRKRSQSISLTFLFQCHCIFMSSSKSALLLFCLSNVTSAEHLEMFK